MLIDMYIPVSERLMWHILDLFFYLHCVYAHVIHICAHACVCMCDSVKKLQKGPWGLKGGLERVGKKKKKKRM